MTVNNKTITLRFRAVDHDNFDEIKEGRKTVETRAATAKYQDIRPGDMLVFVCGRKRLSLTVKKARRFKTISAMLKVIPMKKIMPAVASVAAMRQIYYSYPGYKEKIKACGLVALYLK